MELLAYENRLDNTHRTVFTANLIVPSCLMFGGVSQPPLRLSKVTVFF